MIYLEIDNGLTGGLVWVSDSGEIIRKEVMPIRDNGKNRIVDSHDLVNLLTFERTAHVARGGP